MGTLRADHVICDQGKIEEGGQDRTQTGVQFDWS